MLKVGVIGYGYWGPNIVRNFLAIKETTVVSVCDRNPEALKRVSELYPSVEVTTHADDLINSKKIDVLAIATPISTHFDFARAALESGKHVFVEKPLATTVEEAEQLIELAEKKKLQIAVGHTFIFTGAVRKIKELIDNGTLGRLYYYDSTRISLGLIQQDVNVIWDLATHDFSILDYCIQKKPLAITAQGTDHLGRGRETLAFLTIYFEDNLIAHLNVNWFSPVKVRTTMIGGEKKMLVWDDLQADAKLKVYDKGIMIEDTQGLYDLLVDYRSGDMWSPRLDHTEALKRELMHFTESVVSNKTPMNDGQSGLRVIRMLESADESLKNEGRMVRLN